MLKIILTIVLTLFITSCGFAEKSTSIVPTVPKESTQEINLTTAFDNINGTAIFYNPAQNQFFIHNVPLSDKQSSPCSTFKIFSTYVGLLTNNIDPNNSVRHWNGTIYWYPKWNKDISLDEAFKYSCVWYYRRVIDDIGQETMQSYIDKYAYGNQDISDWQGNLNKSDNPPDLKGFWLESSLKISPKQQILVLQHIFNNLDATNNFTVKNELKNLMLVYEDVSTGLNIYGKTGYGKVNGENTDAWFVGFYEINGQIIYYAVRLDDPLNPNSDSNKAKEIALNIIKHNYQKFIK